MVIMRRDFNDYRKGSYRKIVLFSSNPDRKDKLTFLIHKERSPLNSLSVSLSTIGVNFTWNVLIVFVRIRVIETSHFNWSILKLGDINRIKTAFRGKQLKRRDQCPQ